MSTNLPDPKRIEELKNLGVLNDLINKNPQISYKEVDENLYQFLDLKNNSTKWFKKFVLTLSLLGTVVKGFQYTKKKYLTSDNSTTIPDDSQFMDNNQPDHQQDHQQVKDNNQLNNKIKELEQKLNDQKEQNKILEEQLIYQKQQELNEKNQIIKKIEQEFKQKMGEQKSNLEQDKLHFEKQLSEQKKELDKQLNINKQTLLLFQNYMNLVSIFSNRICMLFQIEINSVMGNKYFSDYDLPKPFDVKSINKWLKENNILGFTNIINAYVVIKHIKPIISANTEKYFIDSLKNIYDFYVTNNNLDKDEFEKSWKILENKFLLKDDDKVFKVQFDKTPIFVKLSERLDKIKSKSTEEQTK